MYANGNTNSGFGYKVDYIISEAYREISNETTDYPM